MRLYSKVAFAVASSLAVLAAAPAALAGGMDPTPERISFDTTLQLTNGEYEVVNA